MYQTIGSIINFFLCMLLYGALNQYGCNHITLNIHFIAIYKPFFTE